VTATLEETTDVAPVKRRGNAALSVAAGEGDEAPDFHAQVEQLKAGGMTHREAWRFVKKSNPEACAAVGMPGRYHRSQLASKG